MTTKSEQNLTSSTTMTAMFGSPHFGRRRRILALGIVAVLIAAACASGEDSTPVVTVPVFTVAPSQTSAPTSAPIVPTTQPVDVNPTLPDETTTTTTLPAVTTTTEAPAIQELLLRGDGIGLARFGAAPDGVIDYVTSILGGNTADTGWVDPYTFGDCSPATVARKIDWGVLSLIFSDLSSYANGRLHFIGWEYGLVGEIGDQPIGLRTPGAMTLGSRVVDLLAEFPEAGVNEGENDLNIPPNFYVSDNFRGLLTGTSGDDIVTVIFGGYGCAE